MPVTRIPPETYLKAKKHKEARHCHAIIRMCRREGYLIRGVFYYQTPDTKCFMTSQIDSIVGDKPAHAPSNPSMVEL